MKLSHVQQALAVAKGQRNNHGNFNFRSTEDILAAVKPFLGEATITLTDDVVEVGGKIFVKSTATFKSADEEISTTGFAKHADMQKGMHDAMLTGSTSSYARKYALNGLLAIDNETDIDTLKVRDVRAAETKKAATAERREAEYNSSELKAEIESIDSSEELTDLWKRMTQMMKDEFRDLMGRQGNDIKIIERNRDIVESLVTAEQVGMTKGASISSAESVRNVFNELDKVEQSNVWDSIDKKYQDMINDAEDEATK